MFCCCDEQNDLQRCHVLQFHYGSYMSKETINEQETTVKLEYTIKMES